MLRPYFGLLECSLDLLRHSGHRRRIICGAHREGFVLKIASFSSRTLRSRTLREEFIAAFNESSTDDLDQDESFLTPIPEEESRHYSPPLAEPSPFYNPDSPGSPSAYFYEPPALLDYTNPAPTIESLTSALTATMSGNAPNVLMPMRGERSAPTFDPKKPNKLIRFFKQLEALFARCNITDEADMKRFATSYLDSDVADTWEALEEYTDVNKTYQELKTRLNNLYNQVSLKYILADLDLLIGERQRLGMRC